MQVIKVEQRSQEWHDFRAGGIGGSEVASILGLSPYKTAYQLFMEKTGKVPPPDLSRNPHIIRGVKNEDRIASIVSAHFKESGESICGIHEEFPHIRCSFDWVTSRAINEIKAPSETQWQWVKDNGPHPYYVVQTEYQAVVAETLGLEARLVYWRDNAGIDELMVFPVELKRARRDQIIDQVTEFWHLIKSNTPPQPDPKRDRIEIVSEDWLATAADWIALNKRIKEANDAVKALKEAQSINEEALARMTGGFPLAVGGGVKFTKFFKNGSVDYNTVIAEHAPELTDEDLNTYRKEGKYEIRVTASKE